MRNRAMGMVCAGLFWVMSPMIGTAAVAPLVNYQAVLSSAGSPVTTQVSVIFTIYDDASAGNVLWTETQMVTPDNGGRFSTQLGAMNPLDESIFAGANRYLGVQVGGDPEMMPRQQMASAPGAFRTGTLDGATGGDITGDVTIKSTSVAFSKEFSAADAVLTLESLAGNKVIIGPADQIALRAEGPLGEEWLSATVDPIDGGLMKVREPGGDSESEMTSHGNNTFQDLSAVKAPNASSFQVEIVNFDNAANTAEYMNGIRNIQAAKDFNAVSPVYTKTFDLLTTEMVESFNNPSTGTSTQHNSLNSTYNVPGSYTKSPGALSEITALKMIVDDATGDMTMVVGPSDISSVKDASALSPIFAIKMTEFGPYIEMTDQQLIAGKAPSLATEKLQFGRFDGELKMRQVDIGSGNVLSEFKKDSWTLYDPTTGNAKITADNLNGVSIMDPVSQETNLIFDGSGNVYSRGQAVCGQQSLTAFKEGTKAAIVPWATVFGFGNTAQGDSSTISGGHSNLTISPISVISGGANNIAGTDDIDTNSSAEVIGGGYANKAVGWHSTVSGGIGNLILGEYSSIGGGSHDSILTDYSVIGGGHQNAIIRVGVNDRYGTVGGGGGNNILGSSYGTIAGGSSNTVAQAGASIGGGTGNTVSTARGTIAGGMENTIADGQNSSIGGGWGNYIENVNGNCVIAGGKNDSIYSQSAFIGGGNNNLVEAGANGSVIGGGTFNTATSGACVIAGGQYNSAQAYGTVGGGTSNSATGSHAVVAGGERNAATGQYSVVGGGGGFNAVDSNRAHGQFTTVPGGRGNLASGSYAFAVGYHAHATHHGSFVWGGGDGDTVASERSNQVRFSADGGARFDDGSEWVNLYDDATDLISTSTGAHLTLGGTWTNASDVNLKENFSDVDLQTVLQRIAEMPIQSWNYKAEGDGIAHIGPTAQDFYSAFRLGTDDVSISTVDADGVALAAIKALHSENCQLKEELAELKEMINQIMAERK